MRFLAFGLCLLFLTACNVGWKDDDINIIGEEHDIFTLIEYRTLRAELIANGKIDELDHLQNRIDDYPDYLSKIIQIKKADFNVNDLIIFKLRVNLTANFDVTSVNRVDSGAEVTGTIQDTENVTGKIKFTHSGDYTGMQIDYNNKSLFLKKRYRVVPAYLEDAEEEYKYYLLLDVPTDD